MRESASAFLVIVLLLDALTQMPPPGSTVGTDSSVARGPAGEHIRRSLVPSRLARMCTPWAAVRRRREEAVVCVSSSVLVASRFTMATPTTADKDPAEGRAKPRMEGPYAPSLAYGEVGWGATVSRTLFSTGLRKEAVAAPTVRRIAEGWRTDGPADGTVGTREMRKGAVGWRGKRGGTPGSAHRHATRAYPRTTA